MNQRADRAKFAKPARCYAHHFVRVSHRVIECTACNLRRVKDHQPGEKLFTSPETSKDYVKPMKYTPEERKARRTLWGLPGGEMPRRR